MENIESFSGKNLSYVRKVVLATAAGVTSYVKPATGLNVTGTITFSAAVDVVSLTGTFEKCTFTCEESITEHGELFSSRVVMEVPKVQLDTTENFWEILINRLFLLVTLANEQVRILGDTGDGEDVTCVVRESVEQENKYQVEFTWQSSKPPYFYTGSPIGSQEAEEGGGE